MALPSLETVIRAQNLFAKKSLGQHFLTDELLLDHIVDKAGNLDHTHVLEIGPGPGGLTRALLNSPAPTVTVLEKDARFMPALEMLQAHAPAGRMQIHEADALAVDLATLLPGPRTLIANLPYNVGTEILTNMLSQIAMHERNDAAWENIVVMLQMEVAERFVATPNTPAYGRLSVLANWLCEAAIVMHVPPEAFTPPPKVDSAVLMLTPRKEKLFKADYHMMKRVLAVAFNQRRKMLKSGLKPLGVPLDDLFEKTGIDGSLRAQSLSTEDFCAIARYLESHNTSMKSSK